MDRNKKTVLRQPAWSLSIGLAALLFGATHVQAASLTGTAGQVFKLSDLIGNTLTIQDKLFSNFAYTSGGLTDPATDVQATVIFSTPTATVDDHGFLWNKAPGTGAWSDTFTLSYAIEVIASGVTIFASKDVIDTSFVPNLDVLKDTQTGTIGQTMTLDGLATANESAQISWLPPQMKINTSSVLNPNSNHQFVSLEQHFFQQRTIPEPGMMLLFGSGLLGLAVMGRRRGKK